MDTFDFNLHQLVLSDLAASVSDSEDLSSSNDLAVGAISSRVRTRDLSGSEVDPQERVFLVSSLQTLS